MWVFTLKERQMKRNNLRDLGVQEFTLKGLVSTGERAQVTAVQRVVVMSFHPLLIVLCYYGKISQYMTGLHRFNLESHH